jgi:hypothetical protein
MMPEAEIAHLLQVAKKVSRAAIRALKADGTNIFIANGAAAGQKAPHVMIHVVPRRSGDGISCFTLPKNKIGEEDQEKLRLAVKSKVNERFGIKEKEPVIVGRPTPQKIATVVDNRLPAEEKNTEKIEEPIEMIPEPAEEEQMQQEEPAAPEEPEQSQQAEQPKEDYHMFEIPPPEKFEEHHPEGQDEQGRRKRKFDLDSISKLFG